MRSILVQAGRDPGMAARLDTAMDIARANEGHITLLVDTPIDAYVTTDPYGGTWLAREALEQALADDDALAKAYAGRLEHDDVPFDIAQFELPQVDALASAGRLADLIVVSRDSGFVGDLALATRTPVLALGAAKMPFPPQTACVAWDGGDEAAQALRLAAPILSMAKDVSVITIAPENGAKGKQAAFPPTEALRYLARHEVKAELVELPRGDSVEQTLAAEVARRGAQLLVMGAYGHSRVREFLFGGVTRFFLDEAGAPPLFLAH